MNVIVFVDASSLGGQRSVKIFTFSMTTEAFSQVVGKFFPFLGNRTFIYGRSQLKSH